MNKKHLLATLMLASALTLTACSSGSESDTTDPTTPLAVYDVEAANYQDVGNGLNASSADSVAVAKEEGVFTFDEKKHSFTNKSAGYRVTVPDDMTVVDMADATYRSTLASDNTRLNIYTQTLTDDVSTDTYLGYSNRFLENTGDFTKTLDKTETINERTVHLLAWNRTPVSGVEQDRNHYGIVDIVDGKNVYCFQMSSTKAISEDTLRAIAESFDTIDPLLDHEAKDYPRFANVRDNLTDETKELYNTYFADDADLTWGVFAPLVGPDSADDLVAMEDTFDYHFKFALYYTGIQDTYTENTIYDTLTHLWENDTVAELTLQTVNYDAASNRNAVYDILNGEYDDFIRSYAADIARFGHPVLFRPFNEMNGDWCNYSAYWACRDADTYVELYRYIYNIFEEEGANKNTLWIWNPNEKSFPNFAWNYADNYYPGDEYVDIVGITGYNTGSYYEGETWRSFSDIYEPILAQIEPQYQQPLMITEFSCATVGGDKAAWVEDMFASLDNHPRIKVAIWWDGADKDPATDQIARDYYMDNNPDVVNVFREHFAQEKQQAAEKAEQEKDN